MNLDKRFRMHLPNFLNPTSKSLSVPLTVEPAGGQDKGILFSRWFRQTPRMIPSKPSPSIRRWKAQIGVKPLQKTYPKLPTTRQFSTR
jgi:hypothetical protein